MQMYAQRLAAARQALAEADAVLIGAGAGLSAAAGIRYDGERFQAHFADFIDKYGLTDMYSASFYPFKTDEERWAQWARHIYANLYGEAARPLYVALHELVAKRNFFVITTNVERQFIKAGFPAAQVFEVQGTYGTFQCARACHPTLYDNEAQILAMRAAIKDCRIPTALLPRCPVCAGPMDVNLRYNQYFVEDAHWHAAADRYRAFLDDHAGRKLVLLELGVGFNTPGIIRHPFEQMLRGHAERTLIRINQDHARGPVGLLGQVILFDEEMAQVIGALHEKGGAEDGSNGSAAWAD